MLNSQTPAGDDKAWGQVRSPAHRGHTARAVFERGPGADQSPRLSPLRWPQEGTGFALQQLSVALW